MDLASAVREWKEKRKAADAVYLELIDARAARGAASSEYEQMATRSRLLKVEEEYAQATAAARAARITMDRIKYGLSASA